MFKKISLLLLLSTLMYLSGCDFEETNPSDDNSSLAVPIISIKETFETTYEVGSTEPDWLQALEVTKPGGQGFISLDVDYTNVDMDTVGTYEVVYEISYREPDHDEYSFSTDKTLEITVVDTASPNVTLEQSYEVGSEQPDWRTFATFNDDYDQDEDLEVIVMSHVDMNTVGSYEVKVVATDLSNNETTVTIIVTIEDTTSPAISIYEYLPKTFEAGSSEPDWNAYVSVTDNYDETITVDDIDLSNVDMNTLGTFDVIYHATDANGNDRSETMTVTIQDTTIPVIMVDETKATTYEVGIPAPEWYSFVSVTDNYDETIIIDLVDESNVDMDTVGTFDVIYYAVDSNGNAVSETITITIVDSISPVKNDLFGDKTVQEWRATYSDTIGIDHDQNGIPDWQEQEIEIVYASHFFDDEDAYNTLFRNAQKWAEQYDHITVVRDQRFKQSAGDDFDQLNMLVTAAREGTMPDIFYSPLPAEAYDYDLTLDLTPYLRTDSEAQYIGQNTMDYMTSFDGEEIYGVAYMSVSQIPAINVGLLREHNITVPDYDWTYEEYESLRHDVGALTDAGNACIYPGIIDFSQHGPNYFDSMPNGWKGFNVETKRFDLESASGFGSWLEQVAYEGNNGWHFYDLEQTQISEACQNFGWPWGDGTQAIDNTWTYSLSFEIDTLVSERGLDIDFYPMPEAPIGGQTELHAYYETFSLSYTLENDPVKAEAVYNLAKWLSYGADGSTSHFGLIDEDIAMYGETYEEFIAAGGTYTDWPKVHPSTHLLDYSMGWPITTNPAIIENHPLVKGFADDSAFAIYNFDAFKEPELKRQLSDPVAYPDHIPAVSNTFQHFDIWEIKEDIRLEGNTYDEIIGEWDETMNTHFLNDYLRDYNKVNN